MSNVRRPAQYSDDQLREIARQARRFLGVEGRRQIDIVTCLSSPRVWTVAGVKRLLLQVVTDEALIGTDAECTADNNTAVVKVKATVFGDARSGVRRARMTLAHELGHVVLDHRHDVLARISGAKAGTPVSSLRQAFETPAKGFAAHFLVDFALADLCASPADISREFGVSLESSGIIFQKLNKKKERNTVIEGFDRLRDQLSGRDRLEEPVVNKRPANRNDNPVNPLLDLRCYCGKPLRPLFGNKFRCDDCGYVGDPPDGDSYGTLA